MCHHAAAANVSKDEARAYGAAPHPADATPAPRATAGGAVEMRSNTRRGGSRDAPTTAPAGQAAQGDEPPVVDRSSGGFASAAPCGPTPDGPIHAPAPAAVPSRAPVSSSDAEDRPLLRVLSATQHVLHAARSEDKNGADGAACNDDSSAAAAAAGASADAAMDARGSLAPLGQRSPLSDRRSDAVQLLAALNVQRTPGLEELVRRELECGTSCAAIARLLSARIGLTSPDVCDTVTSAFLARIADVQRMHSAPRAAAGAPVPPADDSEGSSGHASDDEGEGGGLPAGGSCLVRGALPLRPLRRSLSSAHDAARMHAQREHGAAAAESAQLGGLAVGEVEVALAGRHADDRNGGIMPAAAAEGDQSSSSSYFGGGEGDSSSSVAGPEQSQADTPHGAASAAQKAAAAMLRWRVTDSDTASGVSRDGYAEDDEASEGTPAATGAAAASAAAHVRRRARPRWARGSLPVATPGWEADHQRWHTTAVPDLVRESAQEAVEDDVVSPVSPMEPGVLQQRAVAVSFSSSTVSTAASTMSAPALSAPVRRPGPSRLRAAEVDDEGHAAEQRLRSAGLSIAELAAGSDEAEAEMVAADHSATGAVAVAAAATAAARPDARRRGSRTGRGSSVDFSVLGHSATVGQALDDAPGPSARKQARSASRAAKNWRLAKTLVRAAAAPRPRAYPALLTFLSLWSQALSVVAFKQGCSPSSAARAGRTGTELVVVNDNARRLWRLLRNAVQTVAAFQASEAHAVEDLDDLLHDIDTFKPPPPDDTPGLQRQSSAMDEMARAEEARGEPAQACSRALALMYALRQRSMCGTRRWCSTDAS